LPQPQEAGAIVSTILQMIKPSLTEVEQCAKGPPMA
jgi:hypothetical protein